DQSGLHATPRRRPREIKELLPKEHRTCQGKRRQERIGARGTKSRRDLLSTRRFEKWSPIVQQRDFGFARNWRQKHRSQSIEQSVRVLRASGRIAERRSELPGVPAAAKRHGG